MRYMFVIAFILLISIPGCDDEITAPPEKNYGISGKILDENGTMLTGVNVFYLFDHPYIPNYEVINKPLERSSTSTF